MLTPYSVRLTLLLLVALVLPACASSGPAVPTLDERLVGVWIDLDDVTHTISAGADGYEVEVVDADQEVFNVVTVTYEEGVLSWTYNVPSTGYTVTYRTTSIGEDEISARWNNQTGASGDETLVRK